MTEEEKKIHRCCFTGHRPDRLIEPESEIRTKLETAIRNAIADGFVTFISGMAPGVDIWAAEIVIKLRETEFPDIHLIAASPYKGFEEKADDNRIQHYNRCMENADLVRFICDGYNRSCFQIRNEWMVNHCSRVIAVYNGTPGGTKNTIEYAKKKNVEIVEIDVESKTKKFDILHQRDVIVYAPQLRREEQEFLSMSEDDIVDEGYPF